MLTARSGEPRWQRRACSAALLVAALFASSAFLETLRPPLQDLPQHLAAARVLLDRAHPGFRFDEYFEVEWLRSQYLGTYVLLGAFFHPLRPFVAEPLLWASRCLLVLLALAWPFSTELVYRRLGRGAGLGAFALVLFFNAHLLLGFLNFLLGIVACFVALGLLAAARCRARQALPGRALLAGWGGAALACFYLHVVPFALLGLCVGALFALEQLGPALGRRLRRTGPSGSRESRPARPGAGPYWAFVPALVACAAWLFTPAGASARDAARGSGARGRALFSSIESNWAELPGWLMDGFTSRWDTHWAEAALATFGVWLLVEGGLALGSALRRWRAARRRPSSAIAPGPALAPAAPRASEPAPPDATRAEPPPPALGPSEPRPDAALLWILRAFVPLCCAFYFVLPSSYDWIWPINARFPLLALLFLPLWAPRARAGSPAWRRAPRALAVALALGLSCAETNVARAAFAGFARELGDFDAVLASIPPGQRTAALIFDRGSRHVRFAPFLHLGAYYQAERGGVSFFSFADFPQSPIRFRPEQRPPRVKPRWEWMPERVRDRDLQWFDVVITRGGTGRLAASRRFELASRFGAYRVFRRRDIAPRASDAVR